MNKPLSIPEIKVPALSAETLDRVRQFENALEKCPQVEINVESVLFAGIYARTIKIPAGVVITGALLQVPTRPANIRAVHFKSWRTGRRNQRIRGL